MPFILKVDKESKCLLILWSGPFSSRDNRSYNQDLSNLKATERALPRLHDVRDVDFDIPIKEIHRTRGSESGGKKNKELVQKLRSAVLVRSDRDFVMMRLFVAIYNHPELDLRVFRELDKAKEWVGMDLPGDPFDLLATDNND